MPRRDLSGNVKDFADSRSEGCNTRLEITMQLSTAIGTLALLLAAALVAGHALGEDAVPPASTPKMTTIQKQVDEREAQRRAAAAVHQKKKDEFTRRCSKPIKSPFELEQCKAAYREM